MLGYIEGRCNDETNCRANLFTNNVRGTTTWSPCYFRLLEFLQKNILRNDKSGKGESMTGEPGWIVAVREAERIVGGEKGYVTKEERD